MQDFPYSLVALILMAVAILAALLAAYLLNRVTDELLQARQRERELRQQLYTQYKWSSLPMYRG